MDLMFRMRLSRAVFICGFFFWSRARFDRGLGRLSGIGEEIHRLSNTREQETDR
jgi:hypothetical protein